MSFDVSFGYNIKTVFIAKIIPSRVIGIVACAYSINVVFFHQSDVLQHTANTDNITTIGVYLMSVYAFNEYGLTVHKELCVFDFYLAETNILLKAFKQFFAVLQIYA